MTGSSDITTQSMPTLLKKRILLGAGVGLAVIAVFLVPVHHPDPAWGKLWMIRPLIVTPLAGAMCGVCYHLMDYLRRQLGWNKVLINVLSLIGCVIGLWLGIVLGLDGTLWN